MRPGRYPPLIYVLRGIHVMVAVFLSACLVYLYYVLLTPAEITAYAWAAVAAIVAEGVIFLILRQDCPLSMWQRRHGDDKGFFELFLPPPAARAAFPVLSVLSGVPIVFILWRALR